jgi:hypothetical protein
VTVRGAFTGLASPAGIALDAVGNVWCACDSGNRITELSSTGTLLTGAVGYIGSNIILGAQAIALDRAGNIALSQPFDDGR